MRLSSITLQPACAVPLDILAGLLRRAFADYIVPIGPAAFSPATLQSLVARDDVLLDRSYVALRDGAPVGVALVAVRSARGGPRTRLASMGVAPEARRLGVGRALLERVIADARDRGAAAVTLEAFERNAAAIHLYESHGFVAARRLLGFTLRMSDLPRDVAATAPPAITLREATAPLLLPLITLCAGAEPPEAAPPWQLEAMSLARLGPAASIYAFAEGSGLTAMRPVGYIALTGAGPDARLAGLGVAPAQRRRRLATAALVALHDTRPDIATLSTPPLAPEKSALVPFLTTLGAAPSNEAQVEMRLSL
ncbi:MAG: GNAT family N-acetyltransferase [Chloroflexi bacterium]|nr:GNAT family N-acetyltransferase [Chloroflexota bacterium]